STFLSRWVRVRPVDLSRLALVRQSLYFAHHTVEDLQPRIPETGVGNVHSQAPHQLVRSFRSAGGQELQVGVDELWAFLEVAVVDGQGQQVAERVGVHVARRMHEM